MKRALSILLSVMMVAGLFVALIPSATAATKTTLSQAESTPEPVKNKVLYQEDFEDVDASLTGAELREALGWTVSTDPHSGEKSTPSGATSTIVETGTNDHAIELYAGGTWGNTTIFQDSRLAGGDYYIEYTQKMTENQGTDGQGLGFVSNGDRTNNTTTVHGKTAWQVNLKERGDWDTLAYYEGATGRVDVCHAFDYDTSSTPSYSESDTNKRGSIVGKEIRVRIVVDADFGLIIYTQENGVWTLQATRASADTTTTWAAKSASIGDQILLRLINGPTVQLDDIEIGTILGADDPAFVMQGYQTTFTNPDGSFDIRFLAKASAINDFSQIKSLHYEISLAGESVTGSNSTFITRNVYLSYFYSSVSTNLGSDQIEADGDEFYTALFLEECPAGVIYKVKPVLTFNDDTTVTGNEIAYNPAPLSKNIEYMHFSFDDGYKCFQNLTNNSYDSLFDEPFFGWMKEMNDEYGAVFSVYVFNDDFEAFANSANGGLYADEFQASKSWLRLGLHSPTNNQSVNFAKDGYNTYEVGYDEWTTFLTSAMIVTGNDPDCIDKYHRLHNFAGSDAAISGMIQAGIDFAEATEDTTDTAADYRPAGFLASDDGRDSYYLNSTLSQWLYANDHLNDAGKDLTMLTTDIRAEYFATSPTKFAGSNMYEELVLRHTLADYANTASSMIVFSHENRIQNNTDGVMASIEAACKFARDYGITFAFSDAITYGPTEQDIDTPIADRPVVDEEPDSGADSGLGSNEDIGVELPEIKV